MENVFEMPQEASASVPVVKKARKPRKPMSAEAKKAFVERMRESRKKKMEEKMKLKIAGELVGSPLAKSQDTTNKVVKDVVNSPENPTTKVPQNSPVKAEVRQPTMDYSHFYNLTNNIKLLNDTLSQLGKHSAPAPVPVPAKPVKVIDDAPEPVPKPNNVPRTVPKPNNVPRTVPSPTPKPEKRKVWNCARKCYVYM
jgi:hypothetical protein